jgi:hypothetical protein
MMGRDYQALGHLAAWLIVERNSDSPGVISHNTGIDIDIWRAYDKSVSVHASPWYSRL